METDRPTDLKRKNGYWQGQFIDMLQKSTYPMVFAAVLAGLAACSGEPPSPAPAEPGKAVLVAEVRAGESERSVRLPGVTRAVERTRAAFMHSGRLADRRVERGDAVRAGERLATLHNPTLAPSLAAAEARVRELDEQLVEMEKQVERLQSLAGRGLASEDELDRALARRNATREARRQALARLDDAREQLAEASLRAPFDAVVIDVLAEPGDFLHAGTPVVALAGSGAMEIEVRLPGDLRDHIRPGHPARVADVRHGRESSGTIREIGLADEGRPAPAIIALPDDPAGSWPPGRSVHVFVDWSGPAAVMVPVTAVVDPGTGRARVFRVIGDRAEPVAVQVGAFAGGWVEVRGELSAADRVITAGHGNLLAGERVRVLP